MKIYLTSTTPSCNGPIQEQKIRGNAVPWAVFSQVIPKIDFFYYSHRFSWGNTLKWYVTCDGYINITSPHFIGPIIIDRKKEEKLPPLDHSAHETKCSYFHYFSCKNTHWKDWSHAMVISIVTSPAPFYRTTKHWMKIAALGRRTVGILKWHFSYFPHDCLKTCLQW